MPDVSFTHPLEPYPKLIINAALTGVIPTRRITPHVPIEPKEIIEDAVRCCDAGASIVHIHARDMQGRQTYRRSVYAEIIRGIRRQRKDLIVCASTSGRRHSEFRQRSSVLELEGECKPDTASLTTGSLNFPECPSVNAPQMIERLAAKMQQKGIKPELEVFELGMANTAMVLIKKGLVSAPCYVNILLGSLHTAPATMLNLCAMVNSLPDGSRWAAGGVGKFQLKLNVAALLMGGHFRVGLEDNVYHDNHRTRLSTNVEQVERIVRIAEELGRQPASPCEAREMLGLN